MIALHRICAVMLRQYYIISGNYSRIIPLFMWAAVDIVLWGFITKYLNHITNPGFDFVLAVLGVVLLWDFFIRVMNGVSMAFFEDVWARNFLNFFSTPLSIWEYLLGLVCTGIITSMFGLLAMLLLATLVFGLSFFNYGMMLIPAILGVFMFGIALGIVSSAIVMRYGPASEWFMWSVPAILSPFAGVFYPIATLPHWMQMISFILPPSYLFEGMRAIVFGQAVHWQLIALGGALTLIYLMAALGLFAYVYKEAVRKGLIARYSAETVV